MKFEQWDRKKLRKALSERGWNHDPNAIEDIASQLHSWYLPSKSKVKSERRTLRNAARIAGLVK